MLRTSSASRRSRGVVRTVGVLSAVVVTLIPAISHSQTLLSENFSGGQPSNGSYANGSQISGTQFTPNTGAVFIIDAGGTHGRSMMMLAGSFLGVGTQSSSASATPLFNLLAGYKYTLSFDLSRFNQGTGIAGPWSMTAAIGGNSQTFDNPGFTSEGFDWSTKSFVFNPLVNVSQAALTFTTSGTGYSAAALDNIVLLQEQLPGVPTTTAPEPSTWVMMAVGLVAVGVSRRRART